MTCGGRLDLQGVRVVRRDRDILAIDALTLAPGEFVGLIGSNGAGKTTFLKVCCGLIQPDGGRVCLDGRSWIEFSPWQRTRMRRRFGYIPQQAEYHRELPFTVQEVVTMGRTAARGLLARLDSEDRDRVDTWIERLGLDSQRRQTFRSLSGGEQQKVLIARAMVQAPSLLLLDEPCANLDFGWKCRITEIIEQLYEQGGLTIVLVCHEMSVLPGGKTGRSGVSRIVLMHAGRVVAQGSPDEVLVSDQMRKTYGCRIGAVEIQGRTCVVGLS